MTGPEIVAQKRSMCAEFSQNCKNLKFLKSNKVLRDFNAFLQSH